MKLQKYRCPLCKRIITRYSDKQWIKSDCVASGDVSTRLILIKPEWLKKKK